MRHGSVPRAVTGEWSEHPETAGAPSVIAGGPPPGRPAPIRARNAPPDGRGSSALGMPSRDARAIAEWAHRGQVEPSGRPYIEHVRRVAARVSSEAASVAWLHDVL
jgi:hypothetical protein